MKPVLATWPAKKRTLWFAPMAAGLFLLSFLVVALATQDFFLAMLLPPALAIGGAYALLGWPELARKDGKPLVEPKHKPYLFFVLVPLLALVLYPILGIALTKAGLPLKWLAIVCIVLSLGIAIGTSYWLVGVPDLYAQARAKYQEIPAERRPFLFFPLFVVFFLILYLALGVVTTQLLGKIAPADTSALLNIQVLVLTPLCAILAGVLAWMLVGFPQAILRPKHHLPKVTGRHRPRVFLATFLLLGVPLTIVLGAVLTYTTPLPSMAVLGIAVVLGYMLSLGVAALWWGTPQRWRQYEDYTPGLDPRVRKPLLAGASVASGLAVVIVFGLVGLDLFWGLLAGLLVGALVGLLLTGTHKRIRARRGEGTLVPDLPDRQKSLIFFPVWLGIAVLLFAVLTYLLPGLVGVNALASLVVGLAIAFLLLEQPLLKQLQEERRREREKRKAWEAKRKERLAKAAEESAAADQA